MSLGFTPWTGTTGPTHRQHLASVTFAADMATFSYLNLIYLFYSCTNLASVSGLDNLRGVCSMRYTFSSCAFTTIDFRDFDPSTLTDLFYTFSGCSHLTTIYADSTWALPSSGITGSQCFYSCSTSLVGGNGTVWASNKTGYTYFRIDTASTPGIYTSKSVLFSYDWSSVAKAYPLWVAQHPDYEASSVRRTCPLARSQREGASVLASACQVEPWTDGWDFGAWDSPLIFQYTGTGRIPGYGGHLDLDLFYGTRDDWRRLCAVAGASAGTEEVKEVAISRANYALHDTYSSLALCVVLRTPKGRISAPSSSRRHSPGRSSYRACCRRRGSCSRIRCICCCRHRPSRR